MKRYLGVGISLWVSLMVLTVGCSGLKFVGPSTVTPTPVGGGVATATPSSTPGCASYFDTFNTNTLSNYDYFATGTQLSTTAAAADYQISGGVLEVTPPDTANHGGLAIVNSSNFPSNVSDYTVEADFEMDNYATNLGLFGIAFRTGSNGSFYSFQWNGNFSNADGGVKNWELEKNTGSPTVSFSYPACCVTTPGYTSGSWVHLKVVAVGDNFKCYVNYKDGAGDHLIFNVTDSSSPFTSGGVGVRTYGIANNNVARVDNFFVNAINCPGAVASVTPTPTFTCVPYFSDSFGAGSLSNYNYFMNSTQATTTAAGADYSIASGVMEVAPTNLSNNGGTAVVTNSLLSSSITDYTVEADFEMDSYATNLGVFGIAFRTGANGSFYCFQWNGDFSNADGGTNDWEIEKNTGYPSVAFSYPGCCVTTPGYTLGTWVHLKVVALGDNFKCYVNYNDGKGDQLIFNVTDSASPYTTGGVGFRTYGIANPNVARIKNFVVSPSNCP